MKQSHLSKRVYSQNLDLWKEEQRIIRYLSRLKIEYTVLKGLRLLSRIRKDFLTFKKVGDIDVLVEKKDIKRIFFLMTSIGYKYYGTPRYENGELLFFREDKKMWVEIHTTVLDIVPSHGAIDRLFIPIKDADKKAITRTFIKNKWSVPLEYVVLEMLTNFALKHAFRGYDKLRTIGALMLALSQRERVRTIDLVDKHGMTVYYAVLLNLLDKTGIYESKDTYKVNSTIVMRLYARIYFAIYPIGLVRREYKGEDEEEYNKNLVVIKIICSPIPVFEKMRNVLKLISRFILKFFLPYLGQVDRRQNNYEDLLPKAGRT